MDKTSSPATISSIPTAEGFASSNTFSKTLLIVSFCAIIFITAATGALVVRACVFHRRVARADVETQAFHPLAHAQPAAFSGLTSTQEARNASLEHAVASKIRASQSPPSWTKFILPKSKLKLTEDRVHTSTSDDLLSDAETETVPPLITASSTESSMSTNKPWLLQDPQADPTPQRSSALKVSPSHSFRAHTIGLGICLPSPRLSIDLSAAAFTLAGSGSGPKHARPDDSRSGCETSPLEGEPDADTAAAAAGLLMPPVIPVAKPAPAARPLTRQSLRRAIPYIVVETCHSGAAAAASASSSLSSSPTSSESPPTPEQTSDQSAFPRVVGSEEAVGVSGNPPVVQKDTFGAHGGPFNPCNIFRTNGATAK